MMDGDAGQRDRMKQGDIIIEGTRMPDTGLAEYRYSSTPVPGIAQAVDILSILAAGTVCFVILVNFNPVILEYYIFFTTFVAIIASLLLRNAAMYDLDAIMRPVARSDMVIVSIVSAFLFFLTIAFSLKVSDIYSRAWTYSFLGASISLVIANRILLAALLRRLSRQRIIGRSVVVLGTGPQAEMFLERIARLQPHFTEVRGVFAHETVPESGCFAGHPVLGTTEDLFHYIRANRVDDIVVAMAWSSDRALSKVVEALKELPINVYISMDLAGYQLQFRPVFGQFNQLPLFEVVQKPISGWSYLLKLAEDYVLATLLLFLLSPLMLLIALAIKIDSEGPVFFMQKRIGFNNEIFEIYKFRSMYHRPDPEADFKQAQKDDPRITRVGRFIRRTSLDELPQLLNVLNGTMSLVGPRPHALRHNEDYGRQIRGYFARHKVKPGITGWAQVNGLRGETETLSKMEARVTHDIYYAENWSLLFDLRILAMTVIVVLFQKTAY